MLRKPMPQQTAFEMVSLEGLVPKDHLLRKIEAVIDFSFIHDRVAGLYCPDNGRPPLDPTLMFKALFVGYLFGIRSERQLLREIEVNVAYRWFLGLQLTEPVFDASTLSQNRRRRFDGTTVAQDIFDAIVEQAIAKGLVDGTVLYTDSTHLKANANKNRYDLAVIAKSRADYWDALDAAIDQDREAHDKPPLKPKPRKPDTKETKVSRTDPQAGYMVREGKPKGFFYLDHRTVDGRLGIITDTYATPANVHDFIVYLGRLDRQRQRFGFDVGAVGLDAGYARAGLPRASKSAAFRGDRLSPSNPAAAGHDGEQAVPLRSRRRRISLPAGPASHLCDDGSDRLSPLQERPGHMQRLSNAGLMHVEPQCHPTDHAPCLGRRSRPHRCHRLTPWASVSTSAERRRLSVPSPTPNSSMATATPASAATSPSTASACLPPQHRTSRKSPSLSPPSPSGPEQTSHSLRQHAKQNPAENRRGLSAVRPPEGGSLQPKVLEIRLR